MVLWADPSLSLRLCGMADPSSSLRLGGIAVIDTWNIIQGEEAEVKEEARGAK